jgi:hypothetical protein
MRLTPEENLLSEILREAIDCAAGALECGGLPPLSSGRTSLRPEFLESPDASFRRGKRGASSRASKGYRPIPVRELDAWVI